MDVEFINAKKDWGSLNLDMGLESIMKDLLLGVVSEGITKLYGLWNELGLETSDKMERNGTIQTYLKKLLGRMLNEEIAAKEKILKSLKAHTKRAVRISRELGLSYCSPESSLVLIQYEKAMRQEAGRLADIRNDRMGELKDLERKYKWLCVKLGMDPCHIPSSGVPSTSQLKMLEERIKSLEKLKEERFEQFINLKQSIILMYEQLEVEPLTGLEREIACEEADNFILSTSKLASASSVLTQLEDRRFLNQKMVLEAADKIDRLYKLLQMDANDKCHFLSINRGYKTSIINKLHKEIDRLESMKMENIGKIVNVKRKELHELWDQCFYSSEQRKQFVPLDCVEFTDELLELHEVELGRLQAYFEEHKDLLGMVWQWHRLWEQAMDLERRVGDPSRLMSGGNALLKEEQQRNKVNKMLPRLEREIGIRFAGWEKEQGRQFLVGGMRFSLYVQSQKDEHIAKLKMEKMEKCRAKKKSLRQSIFETMTPTKSSWRESIRKKAPVNSPRTAKKMDQGSKAKSARFCNEESHSSFALRSPKYGRITKVTKSWTGKKKATTRELGINMSKLKIKSSESSESGNGTLASESISTVVDNNISDSTSTGVDNITDDTIRSMALSSASTADSFRSRASTTGTITSASTTDTTRSRALSSASTNATFKSRAWARAFGRDRRM